ncbi:hypothetical protein GCM10028807_45960 [Spirosoma daeguense]
MKGYAQKGFMYEIYGHVGSLMSRQKESNIDVAAIRGAELTISRQTSGAKPWQRAHNFPEMGLSLRWRDIGNNVVYGNDLAVVPFLAFTVWHTPFATLQLKHGTGLAYFTRRYNAEHNPENRLISTRLNAVSLLNLGLILHATSRLDLKVGLEMSHASNGNLRQPNSGLNTISTYLGLRYVPGQQLVIDREPMLRRRNNWRMYAGTAFGVFRAADSSRLIVSPQAEGGVLFEHDVRFRASGGLELMRDPEKGVQLGLKIGEEVLFGHLAICYQLGTYLITPVAGSRIYEKVGLAWYPFQLRNDMPEKLSIGTSLKAHGLRAAFIELNAGYVF